MTWYDLDLLKNNTDLLCFLNMNQMKRATIAMKINRLREMIGFLTSTDTLEHKWIYQSTQCK